MVYCMELLLEFFVVVMSQFDFFFGCNLFCMSFVMGIGECFVQNVVYIYGIKVGFKILGLFVGGFNLGVQVGIVLKGLGFFSYVDYNKLYVMNEYVIDYNLVFIGLFVEFFEVDCCQRVFLFFCFVLYEGVGEFGVVVEGDVVEC